MIHAFSALNSLVLGCWPQLCQFPVCGMLFHWFYSSGPCVPFQSSWITHSKGAPTSLLMSDSALLSSEHPSLTHSSYILNVSLSSWEYSLHKNSDLFYLVTNYIPRTRIEFGSFKAFNKYLLNKRMIHDSQRNQLLRISNNLMCQISMLVCNEKHGVRQNNLFKIKTRAFINYLILDLD